MQLVNFASKSYNRFGQHNTIRKGVPDTDNWKDYLFRRELPKYNGMFHFSEKWNQSYLQQHS